MKWIYDYHGLKTEPSGAIALAAAMHDITFCHKNSSDANVSGDIVIVLSGRNADESSFRSWIDV
jgi:threonine dehydratase